MRYKPEILLQYAKIIQSEDCKTSVAHELIYKCCFYFLISLSFRL